MLSLALRGLAFLVASAVCICAHEPLSGQACDGNSATASLLSLGHSPRHLIQNEVQHAQLAFASEAKLVPAESSTATSYSHGSSRHTLMLAQLLHNDTMVELLALAPWLQWFAPDDSPWVLCAYAGTALFTSMVIIVLYWKSGWGVITRILIYLAALSTMKLAVKNIYATYRWEYPLLVTATHFFCGGVVAFTYLTCREYTGGEKLHVPTLWEFMTVVFPISSGFAVSVVANNVALYFCSASFTEMIGSTSPVWSALLLLAIGQPVSFSAVGPIGLVVFGCVLSTTGEMNFSGIGMACCLISSFGRSVKSTLQQKAMTGELKKIYDPMTLLAWMCVPSFFMMISASLVVEKLTPYQDLGSGSSQKKWGLLFSLAISCVNACILNLSNLFCTRDLGAIGVQLVSQVKGVLTVLGAVALFNEPVTVMQIVGYAAVVTGVITFSRMEQGPPQETPSKS